MLYQVIPQLQKSINKAVLISVSLTLSQTPAYTARPCIQG